MLTAGFTYTPAMSNVSEIEPVEAGPDAVEPQSPPGPPYRLYGGILVCFFVVRVIDIATQDQDWTVWVRNNRPLQVGMVLASVVVSVIAAVYLKSRIPRLLAWLLCGFAGGAATLLLNSSIGLVVGLVMAAPVVFGTAAQGSALRLWLRNVAAPAVLTPCIAGMLGGLLVTVYYTGFGQTSGWLELAVSMGLIAIMLLAMVVVMRRYCSGWIPWLLSTVIFPVSLVLAILCFLTMDSGRRQAAAGGLGISDYGLETVFPAIFTATPRTSWNVLRAFDDSFPKYHVAAVDFTSEATARDHRLAAGFPGLLSVQVSRDSPITDDELGSLHLKYLYGLTVSDGTKLTPAFLKHLNFDRLTYLALTGTNFDDESTSFLASMPTMQTLLLEDTAITSAAVKRNVDPMAPIWHLSLAGSPVDDEIFEFVGNLPTLAVLDLRRTKITGTGLHHLKGVSAQIFLDNTDLNEKHLWDLANADGGDDEPWNTTVIGMLSLRGVDLSMNGLKAIATLDSLSGLNLGHMKFTEELQELLLAMNLQVLELDGATMTPQRFITIPEKTTVGLHWDARDTDFGDIQKKIEELSHIRSMTDHQGGTNGGRCTVVISNLELTRESVADLKKLDKLQTVKFEDALTPNGELKTFWSITSIRKQFAELFAP